MTTVICAMVTYIYIYNGHLPSPIISKHVFIELMKTATTSVEFSFNISPKLRYGQRARAQLPEAGRQGGYHHDAIINK